ncbi:ABC transporter permease [Flavimaricola marinus]|uniref:Ribose transport system permease protein RbsC n=1 Tax=Flavimaricola marinus TaxID=1819565 RepID=A0A238LIJ4_9RHOB|nr:ABC transporter permease [Flavimaricola marinus]SMY09547.1 Ribose transport system permease protein RbsC [Flavimaricola marinus]
MSPQDNYESALEGASQQVASFEDERKGAVARFQSLLHRFPAAVSLIVLLVAIPVFGLLIDREPLMYSLGMVDLEDISNSRYRFFSLRTLSFILDQVMIVGIVGAAQALVILTAGIDLSVGAIMVFSSVIMGQFTFRYGLPVEVSVVAGLAVGALCGFINGFLVARIKLPPFIVTLGMWQIVLATNFLYSANETIRSQDIASEASLLQVFGKAAFTIGGDAEGRGGANFTVGVLFMILLVIGLAYALRNTAWGRHVYAVGDDPEAAELSGVNVKGTLISVYVMSGLICAFAGWALIGRIGSVSPTSGQLANIDSITAVVIGGISLFGGRGSILGMIFGAFIVGVFTMGLRLLGADAQWTYLLIGVLIIAAVAVDQWIRKVSS